MPIIAWHFFYKNFTIHKTLQSEQYILDRIELFKDNAMQLSLWQMNMKIFKSIESGATFLDSAFGYLIHSNDFSETAAEARSMINTGIDKEKTCTETYKNITQQLNFKGLNDGNDFTFFIIQLKGYCNALTNNLPIDIYTNYFNSTQETENFNITDCEAWINRIDIQFYELCENLQKDYSRDVKNLTMIEFFTRIRVLEKNSKKNQ
jgi:hypothetical protein